ncbi:hypothetical protein HRR99_05770 [Agrobacterium vaccinii]|uniref:hypothetical protein n=1 Tax=Agrobacterium TaxID=357 RepID=UPI001E62851E|nr:MULTISPECIES: hypothetical protein [Agrobacterium]UHS61055.1 hypothetical protein HRR99_05770 [Agrobacterium vaccinii]
MSEWSDLIDSQMETISLNFQLLLAMISRNRTSIGDLIELLATTEGVDQTALGKIADEMEKADEKIISMAEVMSAKP